MQNDTPQPSDMEIVSQVLKGHINAFETLLLRYQNLVLKIVKKHVPYDAIEETAQETFIRAYQSLSTFKGTGNFKQWVSSIAMKTCYDHLRKKYRSREIPLSSFSIKHQEWLEEALSKDYEHLNHEKGSQQEAKELLDWALAKLSAEDRIVLELIYLEGHTCRETAKLLGWSVANVKVRSFRSRKKLEKVLTEVIGP